jgi:class 3 adenylate cyclase
MPIRCAKCRFENLSSMSFCGGCGAALVSGCRGCGSENPSNFTFCGTCGLQLAPAQSPPPAHDKAPTDHTDNAERRQLTVMFCDMVDSTALSERLDPEDLRDIVCRYQQVVADVVAAYGGHVAQYLGDGMLVYFGFPVAQEHDAHRAARASVDIIAAVARLDSELDISLKVRIGLHTGPVVTGDVGARGRTERLALGQTPNVAARVQSQAAPGEVLLTEDTLAIVGDAISVERIGPRELRGIAKPVILYRVEPGKRQESQIETRDRTPFVGRERELGTLLELLALAQDGQGQIALIKGEPGIGKSRLYQELRQRASSADINWLTCPCSPFHQSSALYPIIELLKRELDLAQGAGGEVLHERLAPALTNLGVVTEDALELLADLLSVGTAEPILAAMSLDRRRRKTLELLVELLLQMAAHRATVLLVEDLHWADPSTLAVLGLLAERIGDQHLLGIFTHRPTFAETWDPQAHQTLIELQHLDARDVGAMVDAWTGERLPAAVRNAIVARTDGVPLFIEQMTRTLLDLKLDPAAARSAFSVNTADGLIPNTLRDLLMARLDSLGSAKETAQLGAMLGRRFSFEDLAAVSELAGRTLQQHLDRLVDAAILIRAGEAPRADYSFKHALIQDAAYDSLLRRRRLMLHDRAAHVLEAAGTRESDPQRLARHYEGAARWQEGSDLYFQAAAKANASWAYAEAIAILKKSLELLSRVAESEDRHRTEFQLLLTMMQPMTAHYGYTSSSLLEVYERMRELADRLGPEVQAQGVFFNFWAFYCTRGDRSETLQLAEQIQRFAEDSGNADLLALAAFVSGTTSYYLGDRATALPHLTRAVEHFTNLRTQPQPLAGAGNSLFLAWLVRSVALCDAGWIAEGRASIAEAVAFAEAHGGPFHMLQALDYQIWVALNLGEDLEEIAAVAKRAERLRAEYEIGWWDKENAAIHIGAARAARGDASAIADMRRTVEATRSQSSGIRLNLQLVLLARALAALGHLEEAKSCLNETLIRCQTTLAGFPESEACCLLAEIAWQEGDLRTAEELLNRAMADARRQGTPLFELRAAVAFARLLEEQQRFSEGRAALEAVLAKFSDDSNSPHLGQARSILHPQPTTQATTS